MVHQFNATLSELYADEPCNAMMTALREAAREYYAQELASGGLDVDGAIYKYLENTPKTSLVAELVSMLQTLGYDITKRVPKS